MSVEDTIRAWKDPEYRESLDANARASLPDSPVGAPELSGQELRSIQGGVPGGPFRRTASIFRQSRMHVCCAFPPYDVLA